MVQLQLQPNASGSGTSSASSECFRILIPQDFAHLQSSGNTPISPLFLNILGGRQRWLTSSSGTVSCVYSQTHQSLNRFVIKYSKTSKGALDALTNIESREPYPLV